MICKKHRVVFAGQLPYSIGQSQITRRVIGNKRQSPDTHRVICSYGRQHIILVHIGEHSELNAACCPQTHLFEDRVMKIDHVHIGSRVTVGPRSTMLYGTQVQDGAQLGPMTLVMKGESIPSGARFSGAPAKPTAL